MKKVFSLLLFWLFFLPFKAEADEIIKKGAVLNLNNCIEIALKRQPNIVAAVSTVNMNESKVGEAEADYYPQVDLTSGYSRVSSAQASSSSNSTNRSLDQFNGSISLRQNIYDFGKTATQVKVQRLNLDSSRADLENVTEQIVFNVKQWYYSVLQAKRNREVSEEAVRQFEQHLQQAKGFYSVGTKPKFDVTKAEVDLSNARLSMIKAENALKVAIVTLNNAMGVPDAPEYALEDNLLFHKYEITLGDAVERAYKNRHDLLSTIVKRNAAETSVELAKKGYYPVLTGNAAYSVAGERFPLDDGWSVGVSISFPIFSGFLTRHQVEEAKANLNVLRANEEALRQTVLLEVRQAYLNLKEAEEMVPAAELAVKQAAENLDIANGRYAAGVGNTIEVTDAQVSYSNAKLNYIKALSDYRIATASLEKATGVK